MPEREDAISQLLNWLAGLLFVGHTRDVGGRVNADSNL